MTKQQVTVPDIGGAEGAEVIEILVAVGDEVKVDQSLIVLESDKASMEIPSTAAGTVVELLVKEGQDLTEGSPVVVIEVAGDSAQPAADVAAVSPEADQSPSPAVQAGSQVEPAVEAGALEEPQTSSRSVVTVPDIGSEEPVDLIEVCVKVGDSVAEGDSLVVLESDKASMEVPSPAAGVVTEILVNEGGSVMEGADILVLEVAGVVTSVQAESAAPAQVESAAAPAPAKSPAVVAPVPAAPVAVPPADGGSVYAGPAVRKLGREFGIPLAEVSGSGPRGRVVKEDLHRFVQSRLQGVAPATAAAGGALPLIPEVDFSAFGEVEVTQRSKLDKLTARNMQRSWLNVPHVTQFDDADISELEAFRASLKGEAERRGTKITPMPFILKACAVALRDNPKLASSLADGGESLVYKKYINIGMAVDTPAGLVVPVIRDVDKKTIWELAEEVIEMAGKARDRKLKPQDMQGGCFTISSLGNIGGRGFTPIVNAPEVAILGVSRAEMKPVWDGQAFVPRKLLPLSLSYDHRVVNGGDGGRLLNQLVSLLGDIRHMVM